MKIELVLFDFGGVIAEEGFREGIFAIAEKNNLDPRVFFADVSDYIITTGYLTGRCDEQTFWSTLRKQLKIRGSDRELRCAILSRFEIRHWMLTLIEKLQTMHIRTALVSDQTNWLDELDGAHGFFALFDKVFNSYYTHKSKHDPSVFDDVLRSMHGEADRTLFIDDTEGHVQRARQRGLHAILYKDRAGFQQALNIYFSGIALSDF